MTDQYIFNLVDDADNKHTATIQQFIASSAELSPLTRAFYKHYGDDYDFVFFLTVRAPSDRGSAKFREIRRAVCPGLGFTAPVDVGQAYGSPSRLTGVIGMGLLMDEGWSPPTSNHEIMHNWGVYLQGNFGFTKGHWGFASTNGSLGGFDLTTLRDASGKPITDPLSVAPMTRIRVARFDPGASSILKAYAPIELYLMGLVDRSEVEPNIYVMKDPTFVESSGGDLVLQVSGFSRVTLDDIERENPGGPPKATQTAFRAAWVLVSEQPAASEVLAKAERWAKLCGAVQLDVPPSVDEMIAEYVKKHPLAPGMQVNRDMFKVRARYLSFTEATGGRATMDVRLTPRSSQA